MYVLVYVNDILVTKNNSDRVTAMLHQLSTEFSIKDLGPLDFVLGIEAHNHPKGMLLCQTRYIDDLLTRSGLADCKLLLTPMSTTATTSEAGGVPLKDVTQYRSIVGALQYVTLTRPDVAFSVNKVCQYMHSPTEDHWMLVKCILRYLKATRAHGLLIERSPDNTLQAFFDADWAGSSKDRKSTGGYAVYLGPNLVSWNLRKQQTVARSSMESEYKVVADASTKLFVVRIFIS
ncbi:uncharacterized mitochondrial protein AtMg00810-like [Telopea speciosissima]|uniref:uncharacterized mitochondrial protein AtMg00810-like n=1 Tax=Telopea speciosissima TaxID=54955 RepID=UPI001CC82233|nr:uncharacterized mitochondrial protein AtMg00810-like [Telopea speciosissima]